MFNKMAGVGLIGVIRPFEVGLEILQRDFLMLLLLTLALFVPGHVLWPQGMGRVNLREGSLLQGT